ncbi:MAG: IS1595 family transposase [Acidobacteriia bacterium]|nr:IS1595 family transposase [Terriglobia bacterium]
MATNASPQTLQEAVRHYADLDVCQAELVAARWPDGVECPTCGRKDVGYLATQRRWQCKGKHPKRQFSAKVGTIFEDSPIKLDKWFVAIWLISSAKNGISSYELERSIGVTQKTAWFMLHRIRLAMQTRSFLQGKLTGEVEVDETFIGGRARFMHADRRKKTIGLKRGGIVGKIAVMGLLQRHGKDGHSAIRLEVVADTKRHTLQPRVEANVEPGPATTVYTDANNSYNRLGAAYVHQVIDHAEKYVDGQIHTNGCENFWSLLKRGLRGTYVSVEPFHLFRYLDEQAFRFNTRKQTDRARFEEMAQRVIGRRLTYKDLIGKADAQSAA